ncbi:ribonuclease H-like domain-containing protein [Tanacetum coccineum]
MVHNYYLEEAKKKAQLKKDKALNTKPSVQQSARLSNTANVPRGYHVGTHGHTWLTHGCHISDDVACGGPISNTWQLTCLTVKVYEVRDYEEIDGGYVAFGGNPNGGKITGKATKDDTSGTLKSFITGIENLVDHKLKVIRCDNGTEYKNREMNQFCEMKGILRQFSIARTPQQNGVTKRRNMTLIKAARTMIADSKLPTTFWAEAVNTACYVQNRVLVVKPHNKTPYELFHGRTPTLNFMRPFGCIVTILITIDHLGKFDGVLQVRIFIKKDKNKAKRTKLSTGMERVRENEAEGVPVFHRPTQGPLKGQPKS